MLKELQDIGLSENEAKVYLASLELGPATADQLAKQAKIKRPTTYVQIKSLMDVGLMSTYEEGKKTFFAPESPELLKRLLSKQREAVDARERDLSTFLPELIRQFEGAGERPVVRFFSGKEGLVAMREEILRVQEKELLVIFSDDNLAKIFSEKERDEYSTERERRGIRSRLIYTRTGGATKYDELLSKSPTNARYISSDKCSISADVIIYDNKIAYMSTQSRIFGVVLEDANIAVTMRSLFEQVWESAGK